eukprot:gene10467-10625_t
MSRLKALLTGGLPTFLDVGQSFSASSLTEDNLLHQLQAQGKKIVVMGDDTWMQLAKDVYTEAHPYPSFDVNDLHTVDDGVWQHLPEALRHPERWDVLIAHYLGVDHAGHAHGVNSKQMAAKLAQMDDQISQVVEMLVAQAGPGGLYQDTLLLVLSDHGQTLGGDHGGGSPGETDSILLAVNMAALHTSLHHPTGTCPSANDDWTGCHQDAGNCSTADDGASLDLMMSLCAEGGYLEHGPNTTAAAGCTGPATQPSFSASIKPWACSTKMSQIDLTPTLAHMLGTPIPFGNLGRIPPHLYWMLAKGRGGEGMDGKLASNWLETYAAALQHNAQQTAEVIKAQLAYLAAAADLARRRFTLFEQGPIWFGCAVGALVLALQLLHCWQAMRQLFDPTQLPDRANHIAMLIFTLLAGIQVLGLFSVGFLMGEGRLQCLLLGAVTLLLAKTALSTVLRARSTAQQMSEGDRPDGPQQCAAHLSGSVAFETELKAFQDACSQDAVGGVQDSRAELSTAYWGSVQPAVAVVSASAIMLVCNVSLQALGLIDRAGKDPHDKSQPTADLLVGPDAAWQCAVYNVVTVA